MLKWFFCAFVALTSVVFVWATVPRVWNPSPETQTEHSFADFDTSQIEALWPAPGPDDRKRARMVLYKGDVIFADGPTDLIMNTHSMRKSVMSLMCGIAVDKGLIDLDKTLAELGIDENIPLTAQEKTATIRDLLMFRSGVFLPAAGEHDAQITDRPQRDSYEPGAYFFANNFDANALGTIFVQETGYEIGAFMEEFLAKPLGMQDFQAENVIMGDPWFMPSTDTRHPHYHTYMSARDFARVGMMVAQGGVWRGQQVVPESWIALSTAPHSDLRDNHIGYGQYSHAGYLWWLKDADGTIWTDGYGEHFMMIDAARDLVLIERNYTGNSYLSTGLWMFVYGSRSQSLHGMRAAYEWLVQEGL
ncbi:serine hydrolase domain-containing protein [Shimia sp. MIT1388]|uniref:serine hydrolase domain-containing protein n=1 Tax=Shimia sp. MIT1388 TaxID=3096992 RepID=UPI00399A6BF3